MFSYSRDECGRLITNQIDEKETSKITFFSRPNCSHVMGKWCLICYHHLTLNILVY